MEFAQFYRKNETNIVTATIFTILSTNYIHRLTELTTEWSL
jgi:hypothetical protein